MNITYWNLNKKKNEKYIASLISEYNVDIALFSEYDETDFDVLIHNLLLDRYQIHRGYGACRKVILIAKKDIQIEVNREQSRYVLYSVIFNSFKYIFAGIHLPANPHTDANGRKKIIRDLICDLKEQEKIHGNSNVVIIGDFNSSPFDEELIQKDAFNAVMYKEIIEKKESITYEETEYRLLYNPILTHISEDNHQYGSFYYTKGSKSLYWYCYDQVLMTKSLIDSFQGMEYCHTLNGKSLLKDISPNKDISDHLPLVVHFGRGIKNE